MIDMKLYSVPLINWRYSRNYVVQFYKFTRKIHFPIREINLSKNPSNGTEFRVLSIKPPNIVSLCLGPYLKGKCMSLKNKSFIENHIERNQNHGPILLVVGLCRFISEKFNDND